MESMNKAVQMSQHHEVIDEDSADLRPLNIHVGHDVTIVPLLYALGGWTGEDRWCGNLSLHCITTHTTSFSIIISFQLLLYFVLCLFLILCVLPGMINAADFSLYVPGRNTQPQCVSIFLKKLGLRTEHMKMFLQVIRVAIMEKKDLAIASLYMHLWRQGLMHYHKDQLLGFFHQTLFLCTTRGSHDLTDVIKMKMFWLSASSSFLQLQTSADLTFVIGALICVAKNF